MVALSPVDIKKWEKQKYRTYVIYLFTYLLEGVQTSIIAASLWIYLEKEIAVTNKNLLYSVLCGVYCLTPTLFTLLCSTCSPYETNNVKLLSMSCMFLSLIGSLLYTFFARPYLLVVGRFLQGFTPVSCLILSKEIIRTYTPAELHSKLPMTSLFCLIGYVVGPLLALSLTKAEWKLGILHLRYGSLCGFILATITFIQLILLALTKDISAEYEIKVISFETDDDNSKSAISDDDCDDLENEKNDDNECKTSLIEKPDNREPSKNFVNTDMVLILAMTFIGYMWTMMFYWFIPKILHDDLKFGVRETNYYYIGYFLILSLILFNAAKLTIDEDDIFWVGVSTLVSFLIAATSIFVITRSSHWKVSIGFLCIFCIFFGCLELGERTFLPISYRKMLRSKDHCEDNIRVVLRRFGGLIGSSTSVYLLEYYNITFIVIIVTMTLLLVCLCCRRGTVSNPKEVI